MSNAHDETVAEAKTRLMQEARDGTICPVCSSHVKIYRRPLNSGMAFSLICIYKACNAYPGQWLDVGNYCAKVHGFISGEHNKLVWWGLLEKKPLTASQRTNAAKAQNRYRITDKGRQFVEGQIFVLSHAIEYRSQVLEFDGDLVGIRDCLGKKHDYEELMKG